MPEMHIAWMIGLTKVLLAALVCIGMLALLYRDIWEVISNHIFKKKHYAKANKGTDFSNKANRRNK